MVIKRIFGAHDTWVLHINRFRTGRYDINNGAGDGRFCYYTYLKKRE